LSTGSGIIIGQRGKPANTPTGSALSAPVHSIAAGRSLSKPAQAVPDASETDVIFSSTSKTTEGSTSQKSPTIEEISKPTESPPAPHTVSLPEKSTPDVAQHVQTIPSIQEANKNHFQSNQGRGLGSRVNSPSFDINIVNSSVSQNIPIHQSLLLNSGPNSNRIFRNQTILNYGSNVTNLMSNFSQNDDNEKNGQRLDNSADDALPASNKHADLSVSFVKSPFRSLHMKHFNRKKHCTKVLSVLLLIIMQATATWSSVQCI